MSPRFLLVVLLASSTVLAGCASNEDPGTDPTSTDDPTTGTPDTSANDTDNNTEAPDPGVEPQTVALTVRAVGNYPVNPAFDPPTLTAPAGATVELTFENADGTPIIDHDWVLEGVDGAATDVIPPGESTTVTFTLPAEPGEFTYFCSIGDHRDRGMEGTFTVT